MSRLRRAHGDSHLLSVAAEVLEMRSLLSAGAGAAHAAANRASLTYGENAPAAHIPQPPGVPVVASIAVKGIGTASAVPGTFSMSITSLDDGSQVTGAFSLTQGSKSGGGDYVTAKGTFSGHIVTNVTKSGGPTLYILNFDGGRVRETQRTSGHRSSVTAVHPPHNDATLLLTLSGDQSLVQADLDYSITKPKGGGALHFEFVPPASG